MPATTIEERLRRSEERFRELAELLPQTICETDLEGRLTFVNRKALEMFGYTQAEFEAGVTCFQMLAPHERDRGRRNLRRILEGQSSGGTEYTAQRKDGTQFAAVIYSSPILREGAPLGLRAIIVDVTELRQAMALREEAEEKYLTLFLENPDAVFLVDEETGAVVDANPAAETLYEYTRDELLQMKAWDLSAEPEETRRTIRLEVHGVYRVKERLHRRKDGGIVVVEISAAHCELQGRAVNVATIRDITGRKRAEESLQRAEKMQVEAEKLAAAGRMAAQIAHEINNPLAGIKNAFLLIRDAVPEDHPDHDMVRRIDKEIDRIAHVVRQMYMLHSPKPAELTEQLVGDAVQEVLMMLEPLRREHVVTLEAGRIPDALMVRVPRGGLHQILYNLVANAIEASPEGGSVRISVETTDQSVRIGVHDSGPGIAAEVRDRIFDPFFTSKRGGGMVEGMGLGLTTVRSIVDALGGKIQFESTPGRGTVFLVCLPHNVPRLTEEP